MINLEKNNDLNFVRYVIKTNNGNIDIRFQDNYDLYWYYIPTKKTSDNTVIITPENLFVYNLFNDLYEAFSINDPYANSIIKDEIKHTYAGTNNPFVDNKIIWYSDDNALDNANVLTIEKIDEIYKITFERKDNRLGRVIPIRISNSGSRYYPFNTVFMSMYRLLENYNFDYHQIELEEYLYTLELK